MRSKGWARGTPSAKVDPLIIFVMSWPSQPNQFHTGIKIETRTRPEPNTGQPKVSILLAWAMRVCVYPNQVSLLVQLDHLGLCSTNPSLLQSHDPIQKPPTVQPSKYNGPHTSFSLTNEHGCAPMCLTLLYRWTPNSFVISIDWPFSHQCLFLPKGKILLKPRTQKKTENK